jgi:hypothetical protein
MIAKLSAAVVMILTIFGAGCYTVTEAPGARGKVIDSKSGTPLRSALITRKSATRVLYGTSGMDENATQATSIRAGKDGSFDLPPVLHTQIAIMYRRNPERIHGLFLIRADGFAAQEVAGYATSRSRWRVDLGTIFLDQRSAAAPNQSLNDDSAPPSGNSDASEGRHGR